MRIICSCRGILTGDILWKGGKVQHFVFCWSGDPSYLFESVGLDGGDSCWFECFVGRSLYRWFTFKLERRSQLLILFLRDRSSVVTAFLLSWMWHLKECLSECNTLGLDISFMHGLHWMPAVVLGGYNYYGAVLMTMTLQWPWPFQLIGQDLKVVIYRSCSLRSWLLQQHFWEARWKGNVLEQFQE